MLIRSGVVLAMIGDATSPSTHPSARRTAARRHFGAYPSHPVAAGMSAEALRCSTWNTRCPLDVARREGSCDNSPAQYDANHEPALSIKRRTDCSRPATGQAMHERSRYPSHTTVETNRIVTVMVPRGTMSIDR